jgi:hypothetical protein
MKPLLMGSNNDREVKMDTRKFSKKTITAILTVLFMLFGITGAASATIFTIELPELAGELESYPNNPTVVFDFETPFLSIEKTQIHVIGTAS